MAKICLFVLCPCWCIVIWNISTQALLYQHFSWPHSSDISVNVLKKDIVPTLWYVTKLNIIMLLLNCVTCCFSLFISIWGHILQSYAQLVKDWNQIDVLIVSVQIVFVKASIFCHCKYFASLGLQWNLPICYYSLMNLAYFSVQRSSCWFNYGHTLLVMWIIVTLFVSELLNCLQTMDRAQVLMITSYYVDVTFNLTVALSCKHYVTHNEEASIII